MKFFSPEELSPYAGDMILVYGDSGTGKSVSTIQTAPEPIAYLMTEGRDVSKMLVAAQRPGVDIKFGIYRNWPDLIQTICTPKTFEGFKTVVIDSLSHTMAINLSDELIDESYRAQKAKEDDDEIIKDLTAQAKLSQEGFGAVSRLMFRLSNALARLSQLGHVVVCIARKEEHPRYDRALVAAPAFLGRQYPQYAPGFFDFIGLLEPRLDKEGKVLYPPMISFESPGSFLAKWTGLKPQRGTSRMIYDVKKIINASRGITEEKGGKDGEQKAA